MTAADGVAGRLVRGGGVGVCVVPERGARLVSLVAGGREWLVPDRTAPAVPGDAFVRPGLGGWDEAVPTVSAETTADGRALADHGEAWSVGWRVLAEGPDRVTTALALTSAPVDLERTVLGAADGVRLRYAATNRSGEPQPLLWSAHPLLAADPDTVLELPIGDEPLTVDEEYPVRGSSRPLSRESTFADLVSRGPVKLFAPTAAEVDRARLTAADGARLHLSWRGDAPLYLGLFADDGTLGGTPALAVEPCTGRSDSLRRAAEAGECLVLPPAGRVRWEVRLAA